MPDTPPIHPGHQEIVISIIINSDAKSANGGLWPIDLSRIVEHNPGHANYVYNILTAYHYTPPFGHEVPEGRYFNPYHHHMIIGMPRQLYDGMLKFDDGTPSSTPQMV